MIIYVGFLHPLLPTCLGQNERSKDQRVEGRKMLTLENINCLLFSWYKCYFMDLSQANDKNELLLRRKMRLLTWGFLLFLLNIITVYTKSKEFQWNPHNIGPYILFQRRILLLLFIPWFTYVCMHIWIILWTYC